MRRPVGAGPSMADVAARAGVSHQTVSRVLNAPELVRPGTRERVERAIAELGYRRNLAARALATRRTRLIGVLASSLAYYGPSSTVTGIEEAARSAGYATIAGLLRGPGASEVAGLLEEFLAHGVEGVIVVAPHEGVVAAAERAAATVPTVLVADGAGTASGCHVVAVDQALGARLATDHLVGLGCRRIVHVAGPLDWFDARRRVEGWGDALDAAGLERPPIRHGDWSAERGHALGRDLAADLPEAIFCGNDLTALGVLAAFREAGVEVPGRVRVVGFDDVDGSAFFAPPLTTVRQPFDELGRRCLQVLLDAVEGAAPAVHHIAPTLQVRASA